MDVCGIFLGDTNLSYGSMRNPVYRDYEQFPYGTLENCKTPMIKDSYSRVQEKCQQNRIQKSGKQSCPFCKEHKKRPLISYLRKKIYFNNHDKICEEEGEEEEGAEEEQQQHDEEEHHHHNHYHGHDNHSNNQITDKNPTQQIESKINKCEFGPKKNIKV